MNTIHSRIYLGLDLGQRADYTALAGLEFATFTDGRRDPVTYEMITTQRLSLRHLERLPLGTSYPSIARHVLDLLALPELEGRTTLIVDATGPGIPFLDFLTAQRPPANLIKLVITGAGKPHYSRGYHHVPRQVLLHNLAILFQNRAITIAPNLDETQNLLKELSALKTNGHSAAPHDDLAMATALAAWQACKVTQIPPPCTPLPPSNRLPISNPLPTSNPLAPAPGFSPGAPAPAPSALPPNSR